MPITKAAQAPASWPQLSMTHQAPNIEASTSPIHTWKTITRASLKQWLGLQTSHLLRMDASSLLGWNDNIYATITGDKTTPAMLLKQPRHPVGKNQGLTQNAQSAKYQDQLINLDINWGAVAIKPRQTAGKRSSLWDREHAQWLLQVGKSIMAPLRRSGVSCKIHCTSCFSVGLQG